MIFLAFYLLFYSLHTLQYSISDIGKFMTEWSSWTTCTTDCEKQRQRFCTHKDQSLCPGDSMYGVHTEYGTCTQQECYSECIIN